MDLSDHVEEPSLADMDGPQHCSADELMPPSPASVGEGTLTAAHPEEGKAEQRPWKGAHLKGVPCCGIGAHHAVEEADTGVH